MTVIKINDPSLDTIVISLLEVAKILRTSLKKFGESSP